MEQSGSAGLVLRSWRNLVIVCANTSFSSCWLAGAGAAVVEFCELHAHTWDLKMKMELYKRCYRKIPFVASAVCSGCSSSQSAHQTEEQKSNPSFLINLCISWNKMSFQKERKKERNNVLTKGLGCIMISRLTYLSNFDFQTWLNLN